VCISTRSVSWRKLAAQSEPRDARCALPLNHFAQKPVKRGKAGLRNSPYVALPFDSGRMRPELVGFPAPSRLAQRDVAKTFCPEDRNPRGYSPSVRVKGSWRRAKRQAAFTWRTCPDRSGRADLEETKQHIDNPLSVPDRGQFLKADRATPFQLTCVFAVAYVVAGRGMAVPVTSPARTASRAVDVARYGAVHERKPMERRGGTGASSIFLMVANTR
jgi:hypothetical protein